MKEKLLDVAAIRNGTVIDHIPPGNALKIISLCSLEVNQSRTFIGLNLKSTKMKVKDLLKIENLEISQDLLDVIVILGGHSLTVNLIKNFEIVNKFKPRIPKMISVKFCCNNERCISHYEKTPGKFNVISKSNVIDLICFYCDEPYIVK